MCVLVADWWRSRERHGRHCESSVAQGGGGESSDAVLHRHVAAGGSGIRERFRGQGFAVSLFHGFGVCVIFLSDLFHFIYCPTFFSNVVCYNSSSIIHVVTNSMGIDELHRVREYRTLCAIKMERKYRGGDGGNVDRHLCPRIADTTALSYIITAPVIP